MTMTMIVLTKKMGLSVFVRSIFIINELNEIRHQFLKLMLMVFGEPNYSNTYFFFAIIKLEHLKLVVYDAASVKGIVYEPHHHSNKKRRRGFDFYQSKILMV